MRDRISKKNWILYVEPSHEGSEHPMCCDVCDKVDKTIHFSILGDVYLLCPDCVQELYDNINAKDNTE